MASSLDREALGRQLDHLGLSATIRYLLPLILPVEVLPDDTLLTCQRAITVRGNVVHQGQRDVNTKETRAMLKALRQLCEILSRYTGAATT